MIVMKYTDYKPLSDDEANELIEATRYSEIVGEDLFTLLMMEDVAFHEWYYSYKQRMHEEFRKRIETGMSTPMKLLKWQNPGNDDWPHRTPEEVPF